MNNMDSADSAEYHKQSASSPPLGTAINSITPTPTLLRVSSERSPVSTNSIQVPFYDQVRQKTEVSWSTGLCDCFSDIENCCITFWCPCITFGQIAEIVDKGSSSCGTNGALYTVISCLTGGACFYSCFYRSKMRQQYKLKESPCSDCFIHCCCESCALCQEYRELQHRGFDMAIGWHGNIERLNKGVEMAPVVEGGMSR